MAFRTVRPLIVAELIFGLAFSAAAAETIDPGDDGSQYAWAENIGWINLEPLSDGGPGVVILSDLVKGWMWSENTGWVSLSCQNTGSCDRVSFGVTHDGSGNLGGYAWGENIGWISFSCQNTRSCPTVSYGVTIDPGTGLFSGFAWAENVGWVSLSCQNTATCGDVDYRVRTEIPFLSHLLFFDGFESSDTSVWSNTVPPP